MAIDLVYNIDKEKSPIIIGDFAHYTRTEDAFYNGSKLGLGSAVAGLGI